MLCTMQVARFVTLNFKAIPSFKRYRVWLIYRRALRLQFSLDFH